MRRPIVLVVAAMLLGGCTLARGLAARREGKLVLYEAAADPAARDKPPHGAGG
jgi:hypothetical protein